MSKLLRFRLSSVISSFRSCRSKDPSHLPSDPLRSFLRFNRRLHHRSPSPDFKWRKDANWHVIDAQHNNNNKSGAPRRKIYNSSAYDDARQLATKGKKQRRSRRKKTSSRGIQRLSISSADSCLFSEEEEEPGEEMQETLVDSNSSSRSLSTDSSTDFSPHLETIREGPTMLRRRTKKRTIKHNRINNNIIIKSRPWRKMIVEDQRTSEDFGGDQVVPARLSAVFQRLMPCTAVEGKVRESFAVVKRSEDPYQDFKRSMLEMIVEKEMVEERDLEELLRCYLSLNSEQHHGIILTAFHEIRDAFTFSKSTSLPDVDVYSS